MDAQSEWTDIIIQRMKKYYAEHRFLISMKRGTRNINIEKLSQ